jgi:hypothetical protein
MLDACGAVDERRIIKEFMGDKVLGSFVLWFESYHKSLSSLKVPSSGKLPMLDPDRVLKYGLRAIYLVNCCSEGNFYATTDSAQRIHGGVYCHQMADVIAMIQDVCSKDQVVIVGANECYEDDVLMVKNGSAATSLSGWNAINFQSIENALYSGVRKTLSKHNNNVISYGYSVSGKDTVEDEDGLHPPQMKSNTKNNPTVGSQFVALSKVIMDADPTERFFQRSGDVYDARKKYAKRIVVKSSYHNDEGNVNIIEGTSFVGNTLSLKKIKQTKTTCPLDGHVDLYNSGMDGFSGFFGISKTRVSTSGEIVRLGAVGYNRAAVDHVTLQKVVRQTVLHQVGPVTDRSFPVDRRVVFPYVPQMLNGHEAEGGVFAVPSHLNLAVFESLLCTGLMDAQDKHGHSGALVAELISAVPFMNGTDKAFNGFTHIASLDELPAVNMTKYYVDWNNATSGSNFSVGRFQRHRPSCQKPIPLPLIIYNNVKLYLIIKEANDNRLSFSEAMKIAKKDVYGADSLVAGRILRTLSMTGNIISNRYSVGAEISPKLAKRVRAIARYCCIAAAKSFFLTISPNTPCFVCSFILVPSAMVAK